VSQQINLFNPIFLKQKKYFSALTMVQALGLILLGVIAMGVLVRTQLPRVRAEAEAVTAQLEAARQQLATLEAGLRQRQKDGGLEAEVRRLEAEIDGLQKVTVTLGQGEFGNANGYSDYMRAFARQIEDGIWLTSFSIAAGGSEIGIAGRALRPELVPAYLKRLSAEPTMRGRSFDGLEMQEPEDKIGAGQLASVVFRLQSGKQGASSVAGQEQSR